jgi:3-oxoacyl-[acyl-carrier protein] reductase
MRLQGKTAIITGAASGIGRTTAELFAQEGANVVLWDVNVEKGTEVAATLPQAHFQQVDISDLATIEQATKEAVDKFGQIHILINNAGITRDARLVKMTPEQWDAVIDVNLKGVFQCAQVVGKHLAEMGAGCIINASSVVALYGNFGQSNYVAAKAGVIGMTKVWARELGRKGVRVNAVAPGFIATDMLATVPEKVLDSLREKTPLGRLGEPGDIANAFLFLASDAASFITGTTLSVDGGLIS